MAGTGDGPTRNNRAASPLVAKLLKLTLFIGITGALLYGLLSLVPPQYKSVATLQIEGRAGVTVDKPVTRAMSALTSLSNIRSFVEQQALADGNNIAAASSRTGPLQRVLILLGVADDPARTPEDERALVKFGKNLSVQAGAASQTIEIGVRSFDPQEAARLANLYAQSYVAGLEVRPTSRPSDRATEQRAGEISHLRDLIVERQSKLAALRADIRLNPYSPPVRRDKNLDGAVVHGPGVERGEKVRLSLDQLSQLTAQLILAKADREQAELRATLVHDMLKADGRIERTGTVLNTGLAQKLLLRRARMEQKRSDLLIAMLPSHPQVRRLNRSLSALRVEIEAETRKAVASLDNEVLIAAAREDSLRQSLLKLKSQSMTEANVPLGARVDAERYGEQPPVAPRIEKITAMKALIAESRRQLTRAQASADKPLEEAARSTGEAISAKIISAAIVSSQPVFPKKEPITLLGMLAALVLGLVSLLFGRNERDRGAAGAGDEVSVRGESETACNLLKRDEETVRGSGRATPVVFGTRPAPQS